MIYRIYEDLFGNTITEISGRNKVAFFDENTIIMRITKQDGDVHYMFMDNLDYDKCKNYYWYALKDHNTYYAVASILCSDGVNRMVKMHRFLMFDDVVTADKNVMIDHINRNGLDNRRRNLRFTDNRGNQYNAKMTAQNTTGVNGVSYIYGRGNDSRYVASMRLTNGERLHKAFSVGKYGKENALNLAKQQRELWEKEYR